jgi:hypothetical protein
VRSARLSGKSIRGFTAAHLSHAASRSHALPASCRLQHPIDVRATQLGESNISKPNDSEQLTLSTKYLIGTTLTHLTHFR